MLKNIRIILVETSHPGNIGSVARAMKNMGLHSLWLVNPLINLDTHSAALSAGANDIIDNVKIVATLEEAIFGCNLVIGTSTRSRTLPWPILNSQECGSKIVFEAKYAQVALVFGRESSGLTNDELWKCHYRLVIPSDPTFKSLNLAMAVQIIAYEIRVSWLMEKKEKVEYKKIFYPRIEDLDYFYTHLERILLNVGFIHARSSKRVMYKLKCLFTRIRLAYSELSILRGILSSIERKIENNSSFLEKKMEFDIKN